MSSLPSPQVSPPRVAPSMRPEEALSALRVVHVSDDEVTVEGEARAPYVSEPWVWLQWGLALLGAFAYSTASRQWSGLSAFVLPTAWIFGRALRRQRATITFFRGSRCVRWRRGRVQFFMRWQQAEVSQDRFAIELRTVGRELRLPVRGQPRPVQVSTAAEWLNAFADGAQMPAGAEPLVDTTFFECFEFKEASPERVTVEASDPRSLRPLLAVAACCFMIACVYALTVQGCSAWVVGGLLAASGLPLYVPYGGAVVLSRNAGFTVAPAPDAPEGPGDLEVVHLDDSRIPAYVAVVGPRLLRLAQRPAPSRVIPVCANFLRSFAGIRTPTTASEGLPPPDFKLLRISERVDSVVIAGPLRFRKWPFERSSLLFCLVFGCSIGAGAFLIGWTWTLVAVPAAMATLLVRSLLASERPRLVLEKGTRRLSWCGRAGKVPLVWSSMRPHRSGKMIVVDTSAGPLSVPLRRRASKPEILSVIIAIERFFPKSAADDAVSWPPDFCSLLDVGDLDRVDQVSVDVTAGTMGPFGLCFVLSGNVAGGLAVFAVASDQPGAVVPFFALLLLPFLFPVARVRFLRHERSVLVRIRWTETRELITPSTLTLDRLGTSEAGQTVFGLTLHMDERLLTLPFGTFDEEGGKAARAALFSYVDADLPPQERHQ